MFSTIQKNKNVFFLVSFFIGSVALSETPKKVKNTQKVNFHGVNYLFDIYSSDEKGKRPALILVPEYWGKESLIDVHARKLMNEGYIVLTMDLYGNGSSSMSSDQADKLQEKAEKKGLSREYELFEKAYNILRDIPNVDANHIGAVGFGYGGGLILNIAKKNELDIKAYVSFYGGVKKVTNVSQSQKPKASFLYVRPTLDNYTTEKDYQKFEVEMTESYQNFSASVHKGVHYGFVNKGIEKYGQSRNTFMYYDEKESAVAWKNVLEFLKKNLR